MKCVRLISYPNRWNGPTGFCWVPWKSWSSGHEKWEASIFDLSFHKFRPLMIIHLIRVSSKTKRLIIIWGPWAHLFCILRNLGSPSNAHLTLSPSTDCRPITFVFFGKSLLIINCTTQKLSRQYTVFAKF